MSKKNLDRREIRRRRRIRNQIIAYIILAVIIAGVCFAGFKIGGIISDKIGGKSDEPITADTFSEEEVAESEPIMISTPESVIPEEEVVVEVDSVSVENAAARTYIDSLTTEQKVASLFMVNVDALTGVEGTENCGPTTKSMLEKYHVGAVVYTSKNLKKDENFRNLISDMKSYYNELYGSKLWAVVKEDGTTNTIAGSISGVSPMPKAQEIGSSGDNSNAYNSYSDMAKVLKEYGVDINMAPVCDVATNEAGFVKESSFSQDADISASMVGNAVKGQKEQGVYSCLVAFPGQGEATGDSTNVVTTTDKSLDDMKACEFIPFQAGIDEGAPMVMMSHIMAAQASGEAVPSSASKAMINVLRDELGFEGIIVTDDISKKAVTSTNSIEEMSIQSINSGCDMIYVSKDYEKVYNAILEAVNNGEISPERLDEALVRIYTLKFSE